MTLFRIDPVGQPQDYKTYGMSMPLATHWQPATCEDVQCDAYVHGWVTTVDLTTDLGQRQYDYLTHDKTRSCTRQNVTQTLVKFVYKPGNRCFRSADHRLPVGRPARFYVAGGDHRGNPLGTPVRVHKNGADWAEDFAEHQDMIASAIEKG